MKHTLMWSISIFWSFFTQRYEDEKTILPRGDVSARGRDVFDSEKNESVILSNLYYGDLEIP